MHLIVFVGPLSQVMVSQNQGVYLQFLTSETDSILSDGPMYQSNIQSTKMSGLLYFARQTGRSNLEGFGI